MRLNVNRLIVRRGTVIEVCWDANDMTLPELVLTISGKENVIPIDKVGVKKFRIGGSTFKNTIALKATDINGNQRMIKRDVYAYGSVKYDSYTRISPLQKYKDYVVQFWRRYPIEKRRLYIILVLLTTCLIFAGGNPEIAKIILIGAIIYVVYLMFKR